MVLLFVSLSSGFSSDVVAVSVLFFNFSARRAGRAEVIEDVIEDGMEEEIEDGIEDVELLGMSRFAKRLDTGNLLLLLLPPLRSNLLALTLFPLRDQAAVVVPFALPPPPPPPLPPTPPLVMY